MSCRSVDFVLTLEMSLYLALFFCLSSQQAFFSFPQKIVTRKFQPYLILSETEMIDGLRGQHETDLGTNRIRKKCTYIEIFFLTFGLASEMSVVLANSHIV